MEVDGGVGVLAEYAAERWLREAMILPIWEGTPHRQMLDESDLATFTTRTFAEDRIPLDSPPGFPGE